MTWLVFLVVLTCFPFEFSAATIGEETLWQTAWQSPSEIVLNLLLFVPAGVLLSGGLRHRGIAWAVVGAAAIGLLLSFAVEAVQLFLPRRDATFADVLWNTGGTSFGAIARLRWGNGVLTGIAALRARAGRIGVAVVLTGFAAVALWGCAMLQNRTRLSAWDRTYPLLIANEQTGDRPWRGSVFAVEISDAAASMALMRAASRGVHGSIPGKRIAAFDLSGPPPYRDKAGNLPPLAWAAAGRGADPSGASAPWLESVAPAASLTERLQASNAFTIRVLCSSRSPNQQGPARIVSNSVDVGKRNFTIGQQNGDLVFRFRTLHNGPNGSRPEFIVPGVFEEAGPKDVLISYDGSTLLSTVVNSNQVTRAELLPGSSLVLGYTSIELRDGDLRAVNLAFLAVLFFIPGVLASVLAPTRQDAVLANVVFVLAFSGLLESTLSAASSRAFSWPNVLTAAVVGTIALAAATALVSARDLRTGAAGIRSGTWSPAVDPTRAL